MYSWVSGLSHFLWRVNSYLTLRWTALTQLIDVGTWLRIFEKIPQGCHSPSMTHNSCFVENWCWCYLKKWPWWSTQVLPNNQINWINFTYYDHPFNDFAVPPAWCFDTDAATASADTNLWICVISNISSKSLTVFSSSYLRWFSFHFITGLGTIWV